MASVIFRPLAYLSIKHGSARLTSFNWTIPLGAAATLTAVCVVWFPGINLLHSGGVLERLLGFVQSLPGFYMTALAAVATFGKAGLDEAMPGKAPTAVLLYNGQLERMELSRRRFMCLMFSYLTALSLIITLLSIAALSLVDQVRLMLPHAAVEPIRALTMFGIFALIAQMLTITLWGLFYVGERMHTPD